MFIYGRRIWKRGTRTSLAIVSHKKVPSGPPSYPIGTHKADQRVLNAGQDPDIVTGSVTEPC